MPIYKKLEGIRKLSNSSLTALVDVTNINFKDLSAATLEFLKNIKYDETLNSANLKTGNFEYVNISDKLSLKLDNIPTFTIDSLGRAEGQELLVKVSESKRHRFTDFNDWPDVGVPGEVIYTGIQNQKPEFGEDFIGYLDTRGWVSLTNLNSSVTQLILDVLSGSPAIAPIVPLGSGSVWSGPLGLENVFVPTNNTLYYTDVNGDIFDILTDHVWALNGNDASFIPTGNCIIGDIINNGSLRYVDGNQTTGYVLTSDALGNASWQPAPSGGSGSGGAAASYVTVVDFIANSTELISHNLGTTDVHVQLVDLDTNDLIQAHIDGYTSNTLDITFTSDNQNVKVIILAGGASSLTEICGVPIQCGSPGPTDGDTLVYNSSLNIWELTTASSGGSTLTFQRTFTADELISMDYITPSDPYAGIEILPPPGAGKCYVKKSNFVVITYSYDGDIFNTVDPDLLLAIYWPEAGPAGGAPDPISYLGLESSMGESLNIGSATEPTALLADWNMGGQDHSISAPGFINQPWYIGTRGSLTKNSVATEGTISIRFQYAIEDISDIWP